MGFLVGFGFLEVGQVGVGVFLVVYFLGFLLFKTQVFQSLFGTQIAL